MLEKVKRNYEKIEELLCKTLITFAMGLLSMLGMLLLIAILLIRTGDIKVGIANINTRKETFDIRFNLDGHDRWVSINDVNYNEEYLDRILAIGDRE